MRGDRSLFTDANFDIELKEGDIFPGGSAIISICFRPMKAMTYAVTAFCVVTGRSSRLPLRIIGEGISPQLDPSFHKLDVGTVFLKTTHSYDSYLLANHWPMAAEFSVTPADTVFGRAFSFLPMEGCILPDCCQSLNIVFAANTIGSFEEEFIINVKHNSQCLKLTIRLITEFTFSGFNIFLNAHL